MILSDTDILKVIKMGEVKIAPFVESAVQPASVDLTLDSKLYVFDNLDLEYIDVKDQLESLSLLSLDEKNSFFLNPNELVLGATVEKLSLSSQLAARIEGRSSVGRLGVMIQATAGHIAPGFSGNITLEISNISRIPIRLYAGMRIAQIIFETVSSPVLNPYGSSNLNSKYQDQQGPTISKIWQDFEET